MRVVGVRELKNQLSAYLREVRAGERVLVTDRGHVIAELRPPSEGAGDLQYARLMSLSSRGALRISEPNTPTLYPDFSALQPLGRPSAELLDEEREGG